MKNVVTWHRVEWQVFDVRQNQTSREMRSNGIFFFGCILVQNERSYASEMDVDRFQRGVGTYLGTLPTSRTCLTPPSHRKAKTPFCPFGL